MHVDLSITLAIAAILNIAATNTEGSYDEYRESRDLAIDLTTEGVSKYGATIRAVALLQACQQDGLAKALDVSSGDRFKFLLDRLLHLGSQDEKKNAALAKMSAHQRVMLVQVAMDHLLTYQSGYRDAISMAKTHRQPFVILRPALQIGCCVLSSGYPT